MSEGFDAVRLEIMWSGLLSIVEEMSLALKRTAYSELVREANDFSCALFDVDGNMLAQTDWIGSPGHLGSIPKAVKSMFKEYPPETLLPGDVIATNDPWMGSGHLPDIVIMTPIFHRNKLLSFAINIAHHSDIGGRAPGGHVADSHEIFEEGIRIPMLKLHKAGKPNEDVLKFIASNVRMPRQVLGDLKAQMSGNYVGAKRLKEFIEDNKLKDLTALANAVISTSEAATRAAIDELPDGSYSHEELMDGPTYGEPVKLKATVEISGSNMRVDWTGTDRQSDWGLNSVFNYTYAYTTHAIKGATTPTIPFNEGCMRPIEVYAPEGTIVNPKPPAAVAGRHLLSWHINSVIFGALAHVIPDRVLAASGGVGCNMPQFSGVNPRTGKPFIHVSIHAGGLGARADKDGIDCFTFPPRAENTPIEVVETANPLRVEKIEILQNSAGPGKYRGGCGLVIDWRILTEKPCTVVNICDRIEYPAYGLFGGKAGSKSAIILNPGPNEEHPGPKKLTLVKPGSLIRFLLPGGGGYGDPLKRDPALVLEDVQNGYVSLEKAKMDYGVIIDPKTLAIDLKETEKLRKSMK